ncbi:hypothetical protein GEOBC_02277 [Geobacteraceae bacterium]|nr:hypothetical protein GEOBC_02277 [Geobacteraceae bacterium]
MAIDYRERKPVNKNRPKSKPVGLFVVAFGAVACFSFALGILTDRFLLPPRNLKSNSAPMPQSAAQGTNNPASQAADGKDAVPAQQNAPPLPVEPSLTFYETLPKGGKGILGSGINPKRPEIHSATPPKPPVDAPSRKDQAQPQKVDVRPVQKAESPASPVSSQNRSMVSDTAERQKGTGDAAKVVSAKNPTAAKGKFSVQVASAKERKEAEAIKAALQEKGFAAYVVEFPVAGKGTWYRVRVGKQMDQAAAGNLVNQIGKGAIIIPE